jgi:hypothetical protein
MLSPLRHRFIVSPQPGQDAAIMSRPLRSQPGALFAPRRRGNQVACEVQAFEAAVS